MRLVYFTKYDADLSPAELGEKAHRLGVEGMDLAVRAGHAVNPDNAAEALSEAVKVWQGQGLSCELVTAATDLVDPASGDAQRLFAACGQAGVPLIKIGYWNYRLGQDYWQQVDKIRAALTGFAELGRRTGVRACYHTHSGGCYGSTCGAMMHLLRDLDPAHVGAYLDTGHLSVEGERFEIGLAMVGEYLAAVAGKDYRKKLDTSTDPPTWQPQTVKLGQGFFNWRDGLKALGEVGFDGPFSLHGQYENLDQTQRDQWLVDDVEFTKRLLNELR